MEYITLKGIATKASRLCMGGCPAGEYGWGNVSRGEVERAMLRALDMGVTLFDTADTYGLGRSEETLGQVLAPHRQKVLLATKFGVRVENGRTFYDNSPAYMERALTKSLKHLHTDYIDLYQVHYLDGHTPVGEMMEALLRHKRQGRIRAIGLSNLSPGDIPGLLPYAGELATFQQHYSLAHRQEEAGIQQIQSQLGLVLLTWGSLGQGILTGKYGRDVRFEADDRRSRTVYDNFYGEKLERNLRIVEAMGPMAQKYGVPIASIALRWILDTQPQSIAITGVKNPRQAEDNALACTFALTEAEWKQLEALGRE